jgi:hypothetical protein
MQRPRHSEPAVHDQVTIPEFAELLGFTTARGRHWLHKHQQLLGLPPGFTVVPRTVVELARGLREGDSGYHASKKFEAYLKERL